MGKRSRDEAKRRAARLREVLEGATRVWILMHDAPDPDSLSAALCLREIICGPFGMDARITHGGVIGRPDNRSMVELLDIPLTHVSAVAPEAGECFVCVDTQPGFTNNSLPQGADVRAVIDHHEVEEKPDAPYVDLRTQYGATVTMLSEYVTALGVKVDPRIATAVAFGILSETEDLGRMVSSADLRAYMGVLPKVDHVLLGRMRHPRVERRFFSTLAAALESAQVCRDAVVCHLVELNAADDLARVADTLNSIAGSRWVLCSGGWDDSILLCLRTSDTEADAAQVLERVMAGRGGFGGHGMMAGGRLDADERSDHAAMRREITRTFLGELGYDADCPLEPLLVPAPEEMIPDELQ